jgi:hypothetical protein
MAKDPDVHYTRIRSFISSSETAEVNFFKAKYLFIRPPLRVRTTTVVFGERVNFAATKTCAKLPDLTEVFAEKKRQLKIIDVQCYKLFAWGPEPQCFQNICAVQKTGYATKRSVGFKY